MAKILLVEDDNNLREIYEARLQAEGYNIVSAHDGEEALVVAKAEKPDLIISDVMMPKISGFEMLDILRNTDGLKNVKVIMLTALGQSDDQQRANKLGADRYLVKSQVTLEDIVNEANGILQTSQQSSTTEVSNTPATPTVAPLSQQATSSPPSSSPTSSTNDSLSASSSASNLGQPAQNNAPTAPSNSLSDSTNALPKVTNIPVTSPPNLTTSSSTPSNSVSPATNPPTTQVSANSQGSALNSPINNLTDSMSTSTSDEKQAVDSQIENLIKQPSKPAPVPNPNPNNEAAANAPSNEPFLTPEDKQADETVGYSPQPTGKKVIQPLPDSEKKTNISDLLEQEKAKEIISSSNQAADTAPPTMSAADTAPAPSTPMISPETSTSNSVDPTHMAI